jgi:hypothetical protein
MCYFFSFVTEPGTGNNSGKRFYFDWKYRKSDLEDNSKINDSYHHDSHSSICNYYKLDEDICNEYEFNPLTKIFEIDKINSDVNDSLQAEDWVRNLDFSKVVEPLIIKNIVNPLTDLSENKSFIDDNIIMLLKYWSSSQNSVRRLVDHYLTDQVGSSIKDSVYNHLRNSLIMPIWNSISIHIGNKEYVWDCILNAVIAYTVSFFNIRYAIDVESLHKLWNMSLIPSFDGNIWRLHTGKNADIVFTIRESDLLHFEIK